MTTGRPYWIIAATILVFSGCAQSGSLLSQRTNVGTLKTGLSQLEFQNQQLRRQVANLKSDNRKVEDQLLQEETANGELSARLDDARNLLSRRGVGGDEVGPDFESPTRTLKAGQSNRQRRKPPFARIPGQIDVLPDSGDEPEPRRDSSRNDGQTLREGRRERPSSWLPVVVGVTDSGQPRR